MHSGVKISSLLCFLHQIQHPVTTVSTIVVNITPPVYCLDFWDILYVGACAVVSLLNVSYMSMFPTWLNSDMNNKSCIANFKSEHHLMSCWVIFNNQEATESSVRFGSVVRCFFGGSVRFGGKFWPNHRIFCSKNGQKSRFFSHLFFNYSTKIFSQTFKMILSTLIGAFDDF